MQGDNKIFSQYYRVLELMYDSQVTINDITYTPMSQLDIAESMKCDKMTINSMFKTLIKDGMIEKVKGKRFYCLTKESLRIIKAIKRI